jgi:hypothetical protein
MRRESGINRIVRRTPGEVVHGHARRDQWSPEYVAWRSMKARCLYPSVQNYPRYGGIGIKVSSLWVDDFQAFLDHVGPRPSPKHSLDRWPNPKGDYEPGNVRWATAKEQARNRKSSVFIELDGMAKTVPEWCELLFPGKRFGRNFVRNRTGLCGWTMREALLTPVGWRRGTGPATLAERLTDPRYRHVESEA